MPLPDSFCKACDSFVLEFSEFKEEQVTSETCPDTVPTDDKCFASLRMKQLKKSLCGWLMWSAKTFSLVGQVCPLCDVTEHATLLQA